MADRTLTFTLCPKLDASEGDKVLFKVKDPSIIEDNYGTGLDDPVFYLIEAEITQDIIINCQQHQYTFKYDDSVLHPGSEFTKASIDKITVEDANTQFIKEEIFRLIHS